MDVFIIGAACSLAIGLFWLCIQRYKTKKQIIRRLIILSVAAGIALLISILFASFGPTKNDREGGWMFILLFLIIFGWRFILDAVILFRGKKFEEPNDDKHSSNNKNK